MPDVHLPHIVKIYLPPRAIIIAGFNCHAADYPEILLALGGVDDCCKVCACLPR